MFIQLITLLLDLIFPKFCVSCGKLYTLICATCYEKIDFFSLPIELKLESLFLTSVQACAVYRPPISPLIHSFKYKSVKKIGVILGRMMYQSIPLPSHSIVTAIPLHPRKQKQRGYNQAEVIAQEISKLTNIPFLPLLQRVKHTPSQSSMTDRQQRLNQLTGVFIVNPKYQPQIAGQQVLLIDDVFTTGSTLNECAKVLIKERAKQVFAVTAAHGS